MAMWSNTNTITNDDLFEFFPAQCFPDIEGLQLRIGEKALHITGTDSEWALQSDIVIAIGPGRMSFFYTGELNFQISGKDGIVSISMAEAKANGLPTPQELQMIKRGQPWEFVFSCPGQKKLKIYAEVTGISWTPDVEK